MIRKILLLFIAVLLWSATGLAQAETIKLTSCEWPPYASRSLLNQGFTSEIIAEAFKRVGYETQFRFLPWKRAMLECDRGHYHALYSAYYSRQRAEKYALSQPYAQSPLVFCARKDADIEYQGLYDLIPYRIGVVMGYVNTPEFDNADYLTKDEARDEVQNLLKLLNGRVDLIVIDKYVAIRMLKTHPRLQGKRDQVRFLEPALAMKPLYVMFSRAVPGYEQRVADFNQGLEKVKADGLISDILEKHGLLAIQHGGKPPRHSRLDIRR